MEAAHSFITGHVYKMNAHLVKFTELDELREQAIERALQQCKNGEPFGVDEINRITAQINEHAKHGISPTRVYVTTEMVVEVANRQ